MTMWIFRRLFVFALFAGLFFLGACREAVLDPPREPGDDGVVVGLEVIVQGVRNDVGEVLLSVFTQPEGFPCDSTQATFLLAKPAVAGAMSFDLTLPGGREYAVAILHDEDGDRELAVGLFMIPKEGYAVSNNAKGFASQDFKRAIFLLDAPRTLELQMQYYR